MIGEVVGNFRVIRQLGVGGMGEVWLAEHKDIKTQVAIKVLLPHISADRMHVQRFFNEAIAVSKIKHSGIAKIFDVGFHTQGQAYLVMEFLDGEPLASRIARTGKLSLTAVVEIARQIASVLDSTHSAGITHRDLKPDNAFLVRDDELARGERVKLLDFGIAKLSGASIGMTGAASSMGTPGYMAPEQWQDSAKVDHRADAYSLGCVLFEMACGRLPFVSTSIAESCHVHLNETPPRARSIVPTLPVALDELIARLLAKQPEQRPSMREVSATLATVGEAQPIAVDATMAASSQSMPAGTEVLPVPAAASASAPKPLATTLSAAAGARPTPPVSAPSSIPWRTIVLTAVGVAGVCTIIAAIALNRGSHSPPPDVPDVPAAASSPPAVAPAVVSPTPTPKTTPPPTPAVVTPPPDAAVPAPAIVAPADASVPPSAASPPAIVAAPKPVVGAPASHPVVHKPAAPSSPREAEIERRLESLKRLHDDGTINDAEYARRRAAILGDL